MCKTETAVYSTVRTEKLSGGIIWNANLKQQGNFINVVLARYVSGTYAHHQEH